MGRGKDGVSGLEGLDVVGEGKFGRDGAGVRVGDSSLSFIFG